MTFIGIDNVTSQNKHLLFKPVHLSSSYQEILHKYFNFVTRFINKKNYNLQDHCQPSSINMRLYSCNYKHSPVQNIRNIFHLNKFCKSFIGPGFELKLCSYLNMLALFSHNILQKYVKTVRFYKDDFYMNISLNSTFLYSQLTHDLSHMQKTSLVL